MGGKTRHRALVVALGALAGCHWIFPHDTAPATPPDTSAADRARQGDLPRDRQLVLDLGSDPTDGQRDAVRARDANAPDTRSLWDTKGFTDTKSVPDTKQAFDTKSVPDTKKASDLQGKCASWSNWLCVDAEYFCNASCGGTVVYCDLKGCTCTVGSQTASCTNSLPGWCASCQLAVGSGCCSL